MPVTHRLAWASTALVGAAATAAFAVAALFGLGAAPNNAGVYYVDDAVNTLRLLH